MVGRYVVALLQALAMPLVITGLSMLGRNEAATGWTVINLVCWPVVLLVSIAVHEAGHALAARLVGLEVGMVELGVGRRLARWRRGGLTVLLSTLPFSGRTLVGGKRFSKLRMAVVLLAGPLASALLAWLLFAAQPSGSNSVNTGFAVAELWGVLNASIATVNLVPWSHGTFRSDGLQLVTLPFQPKNELIAAATAPAAFEFMDAMAENDLDRAARAVEAARAIEPAARSTRHCAATLDLIQGRFEEGRNEFMLLLETAPQKTERLVALNNIAWANFMLRRPELLDEADRFSDEASSAARSEPAFLNTRGCVLYWRGDLQGAREHLERAWLLQSAPALRANTSAMLAIVHSAIGEGARAREWLTKSEALPSSVLLAEARRVVTSQE